MTIPAAITFFRDRWETRLLDSCVVTRVFGTIFNETTGQTEETFTEVYDGECLVRPAQASEADFGEARRQEVDYDLYLPHGAVELEVDDQVMVTSTHDPVIPPLTVLRGFSDSYLTRQHYETKAVLND